MRILLVHNFYGSSAPSGENQVFFAEKALLSNRGHEVIEFSRHSDEIRAQGSWGMAKGALATPWNPFSAKAISSVLTRTRPDVVHVHNTFPLISPSIFQAIGLKAASVLTLHNYRLFCAAGIPMREGKVCTECLNKRNVGSALRYGCYRGSRLATLPLALNISLHRTLGTWGKRVDAFIALSEFQKRLMSDAGLPIAKVHVKPNFYPGQPKITSWTDRGNYVVFVGRLSEEKGVVALLNAWLMWGQAAPELRLVGDGPLRSKLESMAMGLPIRFLGQLKPSEAEAQIADARLLVLPSECFEGFPMVIREAFAFGTPVAVSNLGPLPSIVKHGYSGVVFEAANPKCLVQEVIKAWESPVLLQMMGEKARLEFEEKYTEHSNYQTLMEIYEKAICASKMRGLS